MTRGFFVFTQQQSEGANMARKNDESNAAVMDTPKPEAKALILSAMIEVPVTEPNGYCPVNFHFNVTHKLAKLFVMLRDGLHASGATFDDGNGTHHVNSDADAYRWLLAQLEVV